MAHYVSYMDEFFFDIEWFIGDTIEDHTEIENWLSICKIEYEKMNDASRWFKITKTNDAMMFKLSHIEHKRIS